MASYTQRGKTWQYTVSRMINGKSDPIRKGGFRTKTEAMAAATLVEAELLRGDTPQLTKISFEKYFSDWVRIYKVSIKGVTTKRYNDTHNAIKVFFGDKTIQDIKKRDYQEFLNDYGKNRARETTRKLNGHIKQCVEEAVDEGIIRVDFTRKINIIGTNNSKRPEEKHINYNESELLLNEVYSKLEFTMSYYMIYLALTTGMRYAELVGLTRKDFLFDTNEITINKTWDYKTGMGFDTTKNDPSHRIIEVDEVTMSIFKDLFDTTPTNAYDLVFFSPQSKFKVITNASVNKVLRKTLERLEIEVITMHGLRHTHASLLLYRKATIYYVSERLGHANIDTTHRYYSHVIKELREEDTKIAIDTFSKMNLTKDIVQNV